MVALYVAYTLSSVIGLIAIKHAFPGFLAARAAGAIAWGSLIQLGIGSALYVGSFILWMVILSKTPLTVAYPIAIGLTVCFSTLAAVLLLQESVGIEKLGGIGLIILGIVLIFKNP